MIERNEINNNINNVKKITKITHRSLMSPIYGGLLNKKPKGPKGMLTRTRSPSRQNPCAEERRGPLGWFVERAGHGWGFPDSWHGWSTILMVYGWFMDVLWMVTDGLCGYTYGMLWVVNCLWMILHDYGWLWWLWWMDWDRMWWSDKMILPRTVQCYPRRDHQGTMNLMWMRSWATPWNPS